MKHPMRWLWATFRWFVFKVDAEIAHRITIRLIRLGICLGKRPLTLMSGGADLLQRTATEASPQVLGLEFMSRVGLAAGFDKDCEILSALPYLGFGYAEIGTVTPLPQEGNPRPRLFRDPMQGALFNRMGFNGSGAIVVSQRLARVRHKLPPRFRVGINIGKNKATSVDQAAEDYVLALRPFEGLVDYAVINVSSPNTPGLRALQTVEALKPILVGLVNLTGKWQSAPPLFLKLAPELEADELRPLILSMEQVGVQGWVLTNTLAGTLVFSSGSLSGGWSGRVLAAHARKSLETVRKLTSKTIISVGGIDSEKEAAARIEAGADLVQLYTGWVYGGPTFPGDLSRMLKKSKL